MPRGIPGSGPNAGRNGGRKKQKRSKREVIHELPPISTGEMKPTATAKFSEQVLKMKASEVRELVRHNIVRLTNIIDTAQAELDCWNAIEKFDPHAEDEARIAAHEFAGHHSH